MEIVQLHGRLGATPSLARSYPMLRLVHPAPKGKESVISKRRAERAPTPEEQKRIHAAITNLAVAYGGRDVLASVLGVAYKYLNGRKNRSYTFAVLLARAAGIPLEQLLSTRPNEVGACPLCGRKGAR